MERHSDERRSVHRRLGLPGGRRQSAPGRRTEARRAAIAARARNDRAILELHVDDVDRVLERAMGAGASLRNVAETLPTGDRVGALIDPFGHIWALFTATNESEALDAFGVDRNAA